ncbi:HNH endonuclease signature motif containing protein, partial [Microbispora amethystogenes]
GADASPGAEYGDAWPGDDAWPGGNAWAGAGADAPPGAGHGDDPWAGGGAWAGAGADASPGAEHGGDAWPGGEPWLGGEAWAGAEADAPAGAEHGGGQWPGGDAWPGAAGHVPPGVWLRGLPGLILATGQLLPVSSVHRLARTSTLVRIVMDAAGQVLDMGRKVRLATPAQRRAVFARYATCWVDGCPLPSTMCQIDHADDWCSGGLTDLKLHGTGVPVPQPRPLPAPHPLHPP